MGDDGDELVFHTFHFLFFRHVAEGDDPAQDLAILGAHRGREPVDNLELRGDLDDLAGLFVIHVLEESLQVRQVTIGILEDIPAGDEPPGIPVPGVQVGVCDGIVFLLFFILGLEEDFKHLLAAPVGEDHLAGGLAHEDPFLGRVQHRLQALLFNGDAFFCLQQQVFCLLQIPGFFLEIFCPLLDGLLDYDVVLLESIIILPEPLHHGVDMMGQVFELVACFHIYTVVEVVFRNFLGAFNNLIDRLKKKAREKYSRGYADYGKCHEQQIYHVLGFVYLFVEFIEGGPDDKNKAVRAPEPGSGSQSGILEPQGAIDHDIQIVVGLSQDPGAKPVLQDIPGFFQLEGISCKSGEDPVFYVLRDFAADMETGGIRRVPVRNRAVKDLSIL